jgi:hypothetical protein
MNTLRIHTTGVGHCGGRKLCRLGVMVSMPVIAAMVFALVASDLVHAAVFHCPSGDVTCLIAAINAANANGEDDTITLEAGTYTLTTVDNETDGANGLPSITSALSIKGAGAESTILERAATAPLLRLLRVSADGVLQLEGLTVSRGMEDSGGGLANFGGTVQITDVSFLDNLAVHPGGAFWNCGGTATIAGATFARNGGDPGAIANELSDFCRGEGTMTIVNTTVADGNCIFNGNGGTMLVLNSAIVRNTGARHAGGIENIGTLTLINTSVVANTNSLPDIGGIANFGNGVLTLINTTVADNGGPLSAVGGLATGGTAVLVNTILARNSAGVDDAVADCSGVVTSQGSNLIGDLTGCTVTLQPGDLTGDPGLGSLVDDGTPGQAHLPLLAASRAINAGNNQICDEDPRLATDQLGNPRVGICDIGAVEFQGAIVLVNDLVAFDPLRPTFRFTPDPTGCPEGFVGNFRFEARLLNTSDRLLSDLFVEVTTLTNGNLLQNADGSPGGVGARLTVPDEDGFTDGVLSPQESVDVPFIICLQERRLFQFVVDVLGVVDASTEVQARALSVKDRKARAWAPPHE